MRKSRVLFYTASAALLLSLTACGVTITAVHLPDEVQVNVGATAETAATYESKQEAAARPYADLAGGPGHAGPLCRAAVPGKAGAQSAGLGA